MVLCDEVRLYGRPVVAVGANLQASLHGNRGMRRSPVRGVMFDWYASNRCSQKVRRHKHNMPTEPPISIEEIRECLERSGYLMESRLVRALTAADFFVEPNVSHKDPRTGKSREIDLTAESAAGSFRRDVCVKTTFVIEAINNRYPVVLLTERPSSPNADFESYLKFGTSPDPCPFLHEIHIYEEKGADWTNLFSQFCALSKKSGRDELMASHPDDIYSSLLKASEYTEDQVAEFRDWTAGELGKYWRLFVWHPMLVVSGQLLTAKFSADGAVLLQEVPLARLEFNWHDSDSRKTTVVEVIREDSLLERLENIRAQDDKLEARFHELKLSSNPSADSDE